jgi:hypothetical protein
MQRDRAEELTSALSDPTNSFVKIDLLQAATQGCLTSPTAREPIAQRSEMFSPTLLNHAALDMYRERQQLRVVARVKFGLSKHCRVDD